MAHVSVALPFGAVISAKRWESSSSSYSSEERVLALHGWLDSASSFNALAPLVLEQDCNLIIYAPEFLGHGLSSHLEPRNGQVYGLADYIFAILGFLEAINWLDGKQFNLVGHSMGGLTASFIAAIIPEHVQSLFLIEALGGAMEAGKHSPEQILQSYQSLKSLSGKIPKAYANRKEAAIARKNGITKMFNGTRWISYEACYELTERCCVPHPTGETGKIAFSHDPLLRQPSPFSLSEEANQQVLKKISCPFEVVRGIQGLRHSYWDQRLAFMKANNPRFRVHYVEGHHHVHMENPKPIAEIYIEFIKRNKNEATKSKL